MTLLWIVLFFSCGMLAASPNSLANSFLSLVSGDDFLAADRHAEVHSRWLHGGSAGGEEEVLLPGGKTLYLLLSDGRVS